MLARTASVKLPGYFLRPVHRTFATTASIKDRFQEAWLEKQAQAPKAEATKSDYVADFRKVKKGYVHPYHSQSHPLLFSSALGYYNSMQEATGPEQVSPHYETLSRSRRGVLFIAAYIGTITTIAQLGGWDHNEWLRGLVFHHEFLIAFFIGYIEIRHFSWLPGPKFTTFYDVFSKYEYKQLMSQWQDTVEEQQVDHLRETKEQIEYMRIHNEYRFVKKRSLMNYLSNSKLNLDKHFHNRAVSMLGSIKRFETENMSSQLRGVAQSALDSTLKALQTDPEGTRRSSFEAALEGIRRGQMDYANDPVMPVLREQIASKAAHLKSLSAEEESQLLALTETQRNAIANQDRSAKDGYLSAVPQVHSPSLKSHDKFRDFVDLLSQMK